MKPVRVLLIPSLLSAFALLAAAQSRFSSRVDSPTGNTPLAITALDYNADGRVDLAVSNIGDGSVWLMPGNGSANFSTNISTIAAAAALGLRDYDEDGRPDLIMSTQQVDVGAAFSIWMKLSTNPVIYHGQTQSVDTGQELATADLNGDGHQDVAIASPIGGVLTVVLCNGNGTCQSSPVNYTAGSLPWGVAAGDFNGDGKIDLAVTLNGENAIAVFLNAGNGTFTGPVKFATGGGPTWVSVADFNGDGKLDLAVVNSGASTVSILLGNGDGTFRAKTDFAAGNYGMAVADLNGDGKLDLAVTSSTANTVSILTGNGDGTFTLSQTLPAGHNTRHIVAVDIDGDGLMDLAATNASDNTVSVWLNNPSASQTPYPAAVLPAASTGTSQTFTVTYGAFGGYQTLDVVNVLINKFLDGRQACYLAYSRPANTLYIVADNGDASQLSGHAMNGSGTVSNSQCSVDLSKSSATGAGNTLTLSLNITFSGSFAGNRVIYSAARDTTGRNSGWSTMASFGVSGGAATFPIPNLATPVDGVTTSETFTFTYQDASSATNLQTVWTIINTALDGRSACYIAYYRPGNQLFLVPDNGDGSQATNIVLTGNNTISNSQCTVSAKGSSVTVNGATLTLTLPITFKPSFAGHRGFWLAAQTLNAAQTSDWQSLGNWLVPSQLVQ